MFLFSIKQRWNSLCEKCNKNVSVRFFTLIVVCLAGALAVAAPLILIDFNFDEYQLLKLLGYCILSTPLLGLGLGSIFDNEFVGRTNRTRFETLGVILTCLFIALLFKVYWSFGIFYILAVVGWNIAFLVKFLQIVLNILED